MLQLFTWQDSHLWVEVPHYTTANDDLELITPHTQGRALLLLQLAFLYILHVILNHISATRDQA